ncbi:MAG TPA: glycogen debranching enzyme N-terminal domain-containing protein, partial [Bacteroidales bacterium]|nr:glycogen debranching enzyme N-terminal domain-containing protein [Bacteroidales bacterium]
MAYLQFNKHELGNLEYSLNREILSTNRAGGYLNTTLPGCNTRKYHGLMVVPVDRLGGENYVLLSSLDETLIQHDQAFNLGIHRYPGIYEPRGHKYIIDLEMDKIIVLTYRIGGMIFKKEIVFLHNKEQLLIRYTLIEAHSPTTLRLKPFLAFRKIHDLTFANLAADTFHSTVEKGVGYCLYENFPRLYMQLSVANEFVKYPDWYKNIEYLREKDRGYDYHEDLFVPGYFECPIHKGRSIVFSASLVPVAPSGLQAVFNRELANRPSRDSFSNCLKLSASQFIITRNGKTQVFAGYPWS